MIAMIEDWNCSNSNAIKPYIANSSSTINANVFFTFENNNSAGIVGDAWIDVICSSDSSVRSSVVEYYNTDNQTAWVRSKGCP